MKKLLTMFMFAISIFTNCEGQTKLPKETPLAEARKQAAAFFAAMDTDKTGKTMYQARFTPFFATEWTDATPTKWASYVYASGMEPALMDGERVAAPFAKITFNPTTQKASLEKLSSRLEDNGIQGVKPLPEGSLEILKSEKEVEIILLQTKNRAELSAAKNQKAVAFYKSWKKYNGVIYQTIANGHDEFNRWVDE